MNILIFILLFILFSCNYPDIDTVPKYNLKKLSKKDVVILHKSVLMIKMNVI